MRYLFRFPLALSISLGILLLSACHPATPKANEPSYGFRYEKTTIHQPNKLAPHRFGYLSVPENRRTSNGKTVELPVYIFKSRHPNPQPDPVIYLVGGPGASVMNAAPYMNYYRYLDDRDFILFEQRGTRFAQPSLDCPEWGAAIQQINAEQLSGTQEEELLVESARRCRDRFLRRGIDANGYNSEEIAADVMDLIRELDLDSVNLLSLSYGTKIAQVLVRDHPEVIRSVVFDSALPLEVNWEEEYMANLDHFFRTVWSRCSDDSSCREAFPDLSDKFRHYIQRLNASPLRLSLTPTNRDTTVTVEVRGAEIINWLSNFSTADIPSIPLRMSELMAGDTSHLLHYFSGLGSGGGSGLAMGMRLSVWCGEEAPFVSEASVATTKSAYPLLGGVDPVFFSKAVCDCWKVRPADKRENAPVASQVPVLFISGGFDIATPPRWAENMLKRFPNGHHLVYPNAGHTPTTYWSKPCGMMAANAFFNRPLENPNPPCLEEWNREFRWELPE